MFNTNRKTKIIATIGPASSAPAVIKKLIQAGVNVFRLNFSHADYNSAEKSICDIRKISDKFNKTVSILIDLQGPKIRIGKFENGSVILKKGQKFTLTTEEIIGNSDKATSSYKELAKDAQKGNVILLNDGKIRLRVEAKDEKNIYTKVLEGGLLSDHKGMNLPKMKISTAALTEKDRQDVLFGLKQKVDYFALSFVREPKDIQDLKDFLCSHSSEIPIISKIEKPEALEKLDQIIDLSDAIMVARGDLGVELPMEKVPEIQKEIIRRANYLGKPVIVATQMLESMIENSTPTRAEVSDVANAIFDWADAVMLSGETAMGKHPITVVKTMADIATNVDVIQSRHKRNLKTRKTHFIREESVVSSLCDSADELADEIGAKAIITFTDSGRTALLLSKYRTSVPIIAIGDKPAICGKMGLYRGVWPVHSTIPFKQMQGLKEMLKQAEARALELKLVKKNDLVVMMAGIPIGTKGSTNMIRVHKIGEPL